MGKFTDYAVALDDTHRWYLWENYPKAPKRLFGPAPKDKCCACGGFYEDYFGTNVYVLKEILIAGVSLDEVERSKK